MEKLKYQSGFNNQFSTEAKAGALPEGQSMPQKPPFGLYAEQINGTAFTSSRHENLRTWFYRLRPSVVSQGEFKETSFPLIKSHPFDHVPTPPHQIRWAPVPIPKEKKDFLDGLVTMAGNAAMAVHVYACNETMDRFFYNADGDMMIVPQQGKLTIHTEMGILEVEPQEICVIPRGIKFQVEIKGACRGYVGENYGAAFNLPGLGPIGANGLANPRDFLAPVANFEDKKGPFKTVCKFQGRMWETEGAYSPFDVVAWHGNFTPYKYDLRKFQTINTVSFDHPDPSIFTVLTSPSFKLGTANIDFVIFPPRWMVAENTFRPPYFHRNVMSEFMGLIHGEYDAKAEGFLPGGGSLHNCMTPHGPDAETFDKATKATLKPQYLADTMAFMFESCLVFHPTEYALTAKFRDKKYLDCWQGLKSHFKN